MIKGFGDYLSCADQMCRRVIYALAIKNIYDGGFGSQLETRARKSTAGGLHALYISTHHSGVFPGVFSPLSFSCGSRRARSSPYTLIKLRRQF